jgi:uncharacterized delta-60 repeat protein
LVAIVRALAPSDLDPAFDGDGVATVDLGGWDGCEAILVQPDWRIVCAGGRWLPGSGAFAIVRYNWDGSLDTTYSGDGLVTTTLGGGNHTGARAAALQPDGKLVAAGKVGSSDEGHFAVIRYDRMGALDPTFHGDGVVTTTVGSTRSEFVDTAGVAVCSDGKVVVAGTAQFSDVDFVLLRYDTDGWLDNSFGLNGIAAANLGRDFDIAGALAVQTDGKLVVVGRSADGAPANADFAVARFHPEGGLDASFDADGIVFTAASGGFDGLDAVAIQPDGKIVAAGEAGQDLAVARYSVTGTLDASFDGDGIVVTDFGAAGAEAYDVVIQSDGKIVVVGGLWSGSGGDIVVARFDQYGGLDATFDGDGYAILDNGGNDDWGRAIALRVGYILVAGSSSPPEPPLHVRLLTGPAGWGLAPGGVTAYPQDMLIARYLGESRAVYVPVAARNHQ